MRWHFVKVDEILRRKLETLLEKNEAKDSARDGLSFIDGSEVVFAKW